MLVAVLGLSVVGRADDPEKTVKKAVERSTLNQMGTKPFHLKAIIAPSFATVTRDANCWKGRTPRSCSSF